MATILITGGSGLIGTALTRELLRQGHAVRHLGRRARTVPGVASFTWDPPRGALDPAALIGADHIVHLAGAGIADARWTERRVRELIASRADTAALLLRTAKAQGVVPRSFVSAAGIGWYGAVTTDHRFTEDDPPGTDTIARISRAWEEAVLPWEGLCRTVRLRTGVVLSAEGGAWPRLSRPVRLGLGAALGSGRQWMPWVHIDDVVAAYMKALFDEGMRGVYNLVGGNTTNAEFMRVAARVLRRPFLLPRVPGALLRLALGEMAMVLLEGSRVDHARLRGTGFVFRRPELKEALDPPSTRR